jgi:hypothetical protein
LIVLGTTLVMLKGLDGAHLRSARAQATQLALAQAKEALVARAVFDAERPGSLPCPDLATSNPAFPNVPNDGIADALAGNHCPAYVGRLPWRTLGLPDLRDADGERLWYALSRGLRDDDSAQPVNSDTPGLLSVDGLGDLAAVVFSAGPPLAAQQGRPSNSVADYLDGDNAASDVNFAAGPPTPLLNDTLLPVSRTELMRAVEKRVAGEALKCLQEYAALSAGRYPWAAGLAQSPGSALADEEGLTFGRLPELLTATASHASMSAAWPGGCAVGSAWWKNNWRELVFYAVAPAYAPSASAHGSCSLAACLTVHAAAASSSARVMVLVAGAGANGQDRSVKNLVENYLEQENSTPGDLLFSAVATPIGASFNDVVAFQR